MKANKPNSKEINLHPSKKRKSKSIIKAPKKKLSDDWIMQYTDFFTQEEKVISEEWIEKLCRDYLLWAQSGDIHKAPLILKDFRLSLSIHKLQFQQWMKAFPLLQGTHDLVREIIGSRREKLGLMKVLDSSLVSISMANYDDEWREMREWMATLRNDRDDKKTNITVVIPPFEGSESKALKKSESNTLTLSESKPAETPEEVASKETRRTRSTLGNLHNR